MKTAIALTLCASVTGCALFDKDASPEEKYYQVQEAYILVVSSLLEAKRAGVISQEDWTDTVNPLIQKGNDLLDQIEAVGPVNTLLQALGSVLLELQTEEAKL